MLPADGIEQPSFFCFFFAQNKETHMICIFIFAAFQKFSSNLLDISWEHSQYMEQRGTMKDLESERKDFHIKTQVQKHQQLNGFQHKIDSNTNFTKAHKRLTNLT